MASGCAIIDRCTLIYDEIYWLGYINYLTIIAPRAASCFPLQPCVGKISMHVVYQVCNVNKIKWKKIDVSFIMSKRIRNTKRSVFFIFVTVA